MGNRSRWRLWEPPAEALEALDAFTAILRQHWRDAAAGTHEFFGSAPASWLEVRTAALPRARVRAVGAPAHHFTRGGRLIR